jgi:cytochrome P450
VTTSPRSWPNAEVDGRPVDERTKALFLLLIGGIDTTWTAAERFGIDRQRNRHVAFGVGVHRRLGSNLARMEMKVAIATWLRRVPPFHLRADAPVEWTTGGNVRGPRVIPVAF